MRKADVKEELLESTFAKILEDLDPSRLQHLSFSGLSKWMQCMRLHALTYLRSVPPDRSGSVFTAYGKACHEAGEKVLLTEFKLRKAGVDTSNFENSQGMQKILEEFKVDLVCKMGTLPPDKRPDWKELQEFMGTGIVSLRSIPQFMYDCFGNYRVVATELELRAPIPGVRNPNAPPFLGYLDWIVQDEQGLYHLGDWKTCGFYWRKGKADSPFAKYQLLLYKHFACEQMNIPREQMYAGWAFLPRQAPDRPMLKPCYHQNKDIDEALRTLRDAYFSIIKRRFDKAELPRMCEGRQAPDAKNKRGLKVAFECECKHLCGGPDETQAIPAD